jgi:hypothetical protein
MKNIYVLILFVIAGFINPVKAQYPIPSYNVSVYDKATFEENEQLILSSASPCRMRQVIIHSTVVHMISSTPNISVWIYSLDGQNIYGPYPISSDYTYFEIDNRQWGVRIVTDQEILVDVWIGLGLP